ncbi:hypothetical protein B0H16DRAFT_1716661 [Mycena metata]|uniref:Uncharacterized protein n=1 Tax=Mycena metata TaxID=1033252 RepID=A0AAD7NMW5_9AGAR|nr:hypothetical protein B0H16DRAFT_1716661 [Mycena metata]
MNCRNIGLPDRPTSSPRKAPSKLGHGTRPPARGSSASTPRLRVCTPRMPTASPTASRNLRDGHRPRLVLASRPATPPARAHTDTAPARAITRVSSTRVVGTTVAPPSRPRPST